MVVKIIEYAVALFIGGTICFYFLFPLLGRKLIEFEQKLTTTIKKREDLKRQAKANRQGEHKENL